MHESLSSWDLPNVIISLEFGIGLSWICRLFITTIKQTKPLFEIQAQQKKISKKEELTHPSLKEFGKKGELKNAAFSSSNSGMLEKEGGRGQTVQVLSTYTPGSTAGSTTEGGSRLPHSEYSGAHVLFQAVTWQFHCTWKHCDYPSFTAQTLN